MKVSELAKRTGVAPHVVRYYVRIGLLQPNRRLKNGYKEFGEADAQRLRFIRRTQLLGFTLAEIAEIIGQSMKGQTPCPTVREIIERHIGDCGSELKGMEALCKRMKTALARWKLMPDQLPTGNTICHLIESEDS